MQLEKLTILSKKANRARQIDLNPTTTLILGDNDTGKSSIIKSIYETFGASVRLTAGWDQLDTITAVDFAHHGSKFTILFHRKPKWYLVHAHDTGKRHLFTSVTNGLGPFLGNLFGFKLRLADRNGNMLVPPPAFQLLPFYIDQDLGWREPWASFDQLGQFRDWKRDLQFRGQYIYFS